MNSEKNARKILQLTFRFDLDVFIHQSYILLYERKSIIQDIIQRNLSVTN